MATSHWSVWLSSPTRGEQAERWLAEQLARRNVELLERNYACRLGEIDLILRHEQVVIFTEVRLRKTFDAGFASVDRHKQRRLIQAARHYLGHSHWDGECRFDVVAVTPHQQSFRCDWMVDAFTMSGC